MKIFSIILLVIVIGIILWFVIPYSLLKNEFLNKKQILLEKAYTKKNTFCESEISKKPPLLQKYINYCGLVDKQMMKASYAEYVADFLFKEKEMKINYSQLNVAGVCERLAFIDARMKGIIPFQGIDENSSGMGRMHGVVGKLFTVFDVKGMEMNKSALVTVLAEAVFCPSIFMQEDIEWTEIDENHIEASLTHYDVTVRGIYEINNEGAVTGFYTSDRYEEVEGNLIKRDWSVKCGDYKECNDGITKPSSFEAGWVYDDGVKTYFSSSGVDIQYIY